MKLKPLILPLLFGFVAVIIGLIYSSFCDDVFETEGKVTIMRDQIDDSYLSREVTKNTWVWIKDGLSIEKKLLGDQFLQSMLIKLPDLNNRFKKFLVNKRSDAIRGKNAGGDQTILNDIDYELAFLGHIRSMVKIEYTGGDSSTYIIRVRDKDRALGKQIVMQVIQELRSIVIDRNEAIQNQVLDHYDKNISALQIERSKLAEKDQAKKSLLDERIHSLNQAYSRQEIMLANARAEALTKFNIVNAPFIPLQKIWPKPFLIQVVSLILGLFLGSLLEYAKCHFKT